MSVWYFRGDYIGDISRRKQQRGGGARTRRTDVPEIIHVPRVIEIGVPTFRYLHASADSSASTARVSLLFPRKNFRPPYISVRGIRASYRVDCSRTGTIFQDAVCRARVRNTAGLAFSTFLEGVGAKSIFARRAIVREERQSTGFLSSRVASY